jgi:hypothetical protein
MAPTAHCSSMVPGPAAWPVLKDSPLPKTTSMQPKGSDASHWYLGIVTGSLSSMLPTTDFVCRGNSGMLSLIPCCFAAKLSSPNVTPGSTMATRRARSTVMIFVISLRSTITAPPMLGTVSPRA